MAAKTAGAAAANGAAANPKGAAARRVVDLDKARAARAELQDDPAVLVAGGEQFELPAELPIRFAELLSQGEFTAAITVLLGEQDVERLYALRPPLSFKDVEALAEHVNDIYGMAEGDSDASAGS